MRHVTTGFAASPAAAAYARHVVAATAHDWGLDDMVDLLTLLVSELVTNPVTHAGSGGTLVLSELERGVHVDVADSSPDLPTSPTLDLMASSGRGLRLVDSVADRWGVDVRPVGKIVWFELSTA